MTQSLFKEEFKPGQEQQIIFPDFETAPVSRVTRVKPSKGKKEDITPEDLAAHEELSQLPSQFWNRNTEDLSFKDKAIFAVLKTVSGSICDLLTQVLNKTDIKNHDTFLRLNDNRDGKPLLTVLNHLHLLDDPLIHAALINHSFLKSYQLLLGNNAEIKQWRWTPAEEKNFFRRENPYAQRLMRDFFGTMMTVPVLRGNGIGQDGFMALTEKLRAGNWVNVFPEGTRTRTYGKLNNFKAGVGYLIKNVPDTIILPVGHDGLQDISPKLCGPEILDTKTNQPDKTLFKFNKRIQIVVGEPFDLKDFAESVPDNCEGYLAIADQIRIRLAPYYKEAMELNQQAKLQR